VLFIVQRNNNLASPIEMETTLNSKTETDGTRNQPSGNEPVCKPPASKIVQLFRITGILEGVSYLLLLFVAMPVKYLLGEPVLVEFTGAAHGFLFVAYALLATLATWQMKWPIGVPFQAFIASLLPFGTFWMDRRIVSRLSHR
jgi:integral membrane protein